MAETGPTDRAIVDLLRKRPRMTVADFEESLQVTATAVRQRLARLLAQGLIERQIEPSPTGRGRPSHWYMLTPLGKRRAGSNLPDLALVLWQEVRAVQDPAVRRGLLERLARRLAERYGEEIEGGDLGQRMQQLAGLFASRHVPFEVRQSEGELPVLAAVACPYPELAEQDAAICAMERLMLSTILGVPLVLDQCRLDGSDCCTFQVTGGACS